MTNTSEIAQSLPMIGIIGIVIGSLIVVIILLFLLIYCNNRYSLQSSQNDEHQSLCDGSSVTSKNSSQAYKRTFLQSFANLLQRSNVSSVNDQGNEWKLVSRSSVKNKNFYLKTNHYEKKIDKKFFKNPPPEPVFHNNGSFDSQENLNQDYKGYFQSFFSMKKFSFGDNVESITSSLYGKGRVCFSLSYIHTLDKFYVHLKTLQLPKDTLNFVSLRNSIRQPNGLTNLQFQVSLLKISEEHREEDEQLNSFGSPKLTQVNSCDLNEAKKLDDSFEFSLPVEEGDLAELQLALLLTEVFVNPNSSKKLKKDEGTRASDGRLLGYIRFNINGTALINDPHSLNEIWRDLIIVRSVEDSRKNDYLEKFENLILKPINLSRYSPISKVGQIRLQVKFNPETLTATIIIFAVKNLLSYSTSKVFFQFRVSMFCGGRIMNTKKSSNLNLTTTNLAYSPSKTCSETSPPKSVDVLNVLEESTGCEKKFDTPLKFSFRINSTDFVKNASILGTLISLCSSQGHLIGQVSIGASCFTDGINQEMWDKCLKDPFESKVDWISMK